MPVSGRMLVLTARGRAAAFVLIGMRATAKRLYRALPRGPRSRLTTGLRGRRAAAALTRPAAPPD
ncbi:hypothetical protein [Methylobacterium nodulans]|uniref:hypothetical protein n=1 Tax=Methylobacterium nodulans TaxID=114616 RepID=UPI00031C6E6A|nr:hypothetical protein [Methylobacterium nodulans]